MKPEKGHKALRIGRYSCPGSFYFITLNTLKRNSYFERFEVARLAAKCLNQNKSILAWVVMPDHIHAVIQLPEATLGQLVANLKREIAYVTNREIKWSSNFYDQLIRDKEHLLQVARYIVLNPKRAGLVGSIKDYPFWNAVWF